MDVVGIFEAKTHLSDLVKKVEGGARITITRHGVPVAHLVPVGEPSLGPGVEEAIAAIRELRGQGAGAGIAAEEIKAWIDEGRE